MQMKGTWIIRVPYVIPFGLWTERNPVRHAYFSCTFHFHLCLFNRWPDDDPIVGSKLVALCNNKSPFVVFNGFFYIYKKGRFVEISISHSDTLHSVGLRWTINRPVAETYMTTHNIRKRQTSITPSVVEIEIQGSERPQTARQPGSTYLANGWEMKSRWLSTHCLCSVDCMSLSPMQKSKWEGLNIVHVGDGRWAEGRSLFRVSLYYSQANVTYYGR
jgi:hypothetical protein